MSKVRAMHYVNQFFAGMGGEEKADVPVGMIEGPTGPGKRLQGLLGGSAQIVVTAYCGDNYFAGQTQEALSAILHIARDHQVNLLLAGPAFASGRYGFACQEVCHAMSSALGLKCITAMHGENPGIEAYRQYKDKNVYTFPSTPGVSGMDEALGKMAQFALKLIAGSPLGSSAVEGYISRGFRTVRKEAESGGARAVRMLLHKLSGRPFVTEIPVEALQTIPVAPSIADLSKACLALITTSGVHPVENPDGFRGYQNIKWAKYPIERLDSMLDTIWDVSHGGYNTGFMKQNPNYGVPLDVCRDLEREGVFARIYPYFYVTPGSRGVISIMQRIGKEILLDLKSQGVDGVLQVAT